jgi:hypothetical protein
MRNKDRFTAEAEFRATRPISTESSRRREAQRAKPGALTGFVITTVMLGIVAVLALRVLGVL